MEICQELIRVREGVIQKIGRDPLADPKSWELFDRKLPNELWPFLHDLSGAAKFLETLPECFPADTFASDNEAQECWEKVGNFYKNQTRFHEAISIYYAFYDQLLAAQEANKGRLRKGTPLVWMSDCFTVIGYPVNAKRCLMLALCENAIHEEGKVPSETTGTYWRLVFRHGLSDSEIKRYGERAFELSKDHVVETFYPEWVVQEFDNDWMTELPSPEEGSLYYANKRYISHLISNLGDGTGTALEQLAEYLLSCMAGCRTKKRQRSGSTEYDIICSMEGFEVDFRSEFGRYFLCECKDWKRPADITSMAKFCRILDSIKSRFGILFSKSGISGAGQTEYAEREQLKVFQDRGMVIVVIDQEDLEKVANGMNFIKLLRDKYENVRLDLAKKL
jgi:hypothetical protein